MCLVEYLPQLIEAGIDSLKVEGRTKSLYYVSAVAKTYRQAIDECLNNPSADLHKYFIELQKVGNRGYTTGFALGENKPDSYSYDISKGLAGADFLCEFKGEEKDGAYLVKIKNKININDEVEIITPSEQFTSKIIEIKNEEGEEKPLGNTNDDVWIKFSQSPAEFKYAIARTIGVKSHVS